MSEKTNIAWCDSTVNFWSGCTKVSPGCANCYAETLSNNKFFGGGKTIGKWGKGKERKRHESAFKAALTMNRQPWICDECGQAHAVRGQICLTDGCGCETRHRRRIFSLSMGDIGDTEVSLEWFNDAMVTIDKCDEVIWILCTKRPEDFLTRWLKVCEHWGRTDTQLPSNVIMLTSVENQAMADLRIPQLLKIPAACHGLSLEPLLGAVDLRKSPTPEGFLDVLFCGEEGGEEYSFTRRNYLHWLIIGGESGPSARPCNVDWIRSLLAQGKAAGVATFVKQLGAVPVFAPEYATILGRTSRCEVVIRDKKGGNTAEWPQDLRLQQWPKGF